VAAPQGTLRLTAPFDYGTRLVVPVITEFTRLHPRCDVSFTLSDKTLDFQNIDCAIRVGWLRDSSHVARRIGVFEQYLVCAPSLRPEISRLRGPEGLEALPFVANSSLSDPQVWRFVRKGRGQRSVRMQVRIAINATPAVHAAVLAGAGLSVLPDYLVDADLASGRLERVLPEWTLRSGGIHAVFPAARFRPANVSSFIELMIRAESERRGGAARS
jgi:DNA-binding transcriptional LysR family regulator